MLRAAAWRAAARFIGAVLSVCEAASRIEVELFTEVERSFAAGQLQAPVITAAVVTTPPPAILTTRIAAAAITAASIAAEPCIAVAPSIAAEPYIEVARSPEAEQCEVAAFVLLTMAADGVADPKSLGRCASFLCLQSSVLLSRESARRPR